MPIPVGDSYPTALVTLADVHAHLNLPDSSQDTELQGFIDAATHFVEFQTGPIIPRTYTETHDGGGPWIVVDHPPILSVTSVVEYVAATGYTLTEEALGVDVGAYGFSWEPRGTIYRRTAGNLASRFVGGGRNIAVIYTAGLAAVPGDVRMAVLEDLRGLFTQTQYTRPSAQFGGEIGSNEGEDQWTAGPMRSFPRLAALLEGPSRTPSIA